MIECQFCGKPVIRGSIKTHEKTHHAPKECRFCKESKKFDILGHEENCKYFYKFIRKCSYGFECTLCTSRQTFCSTRSTMHQHLTLQHGILRQNPISVNNLIEDVENDTG